jgi:hypothetical protein
MFEWHTTIAHMKMNHSLRLIALLAGSVCALPAVANPATIVFAATAHAGTSGKDAVPGLPGFVFTNFGKVYGQGSRWITAGTISGSGTAALTDQVIVVGDGTSFQVPAREGVTGVGSNGELLNLSGLAVPRINEDGVWAIAFTPALGNPGLVVKFIGGNYVTVARGGESTGPDGVTWGNTFASAAVQGNGEVAFLADTALGVRVAVTNDGANLLAQEGTTSYIDPPGGEGGLLRTLSFSQAGTALHVAPDVSSTAYLCDVETTSTPKRSVVINGVIVQQVGQSLAGANNEVITGITELWFEADGTWFTRGTTASGTFFTRNGTVIARVTGPIFIGATETFTALTDVKGDRAGNFIVLGTTSAATASNEVAVVNGESVIAREGDPVDLNGDGTFDEPLFIHSFRDRCTLGDDGFLYVGARLKSTASTTSSIGANVSMLRIPLVVNSFCAADFNSDGGVDGADVESFFVAWAAADGLADVNIDGGVDGADVEAFFVVWSAGSC